jgi:hypothetical protein
LCIVWIISTIDDVCVVSFFVMLVATVVVVVGGGGGSLIHSDGQRMND